MVSCGGGFRVIRTPEDSKVVVPRRGTEESVVRRVSWAGSRRKTVKAIGGGVQTLSPEASGYGCLEQKGAHGVIDCVDHALCLAILRGGVRTRHAEVDTMRKKEGT
jgi:hypothetical protein